MDMGGGRGNDMPFDMEKRPPDSFGPDKKNKVMNNEIADHFINIYYGIDSIALVKLFEGTDQAGLVAV